MRLDLIMLFDSIFVVTVVTSACFLTVLEQKIRSGRGSFHVIIIFEIF